MRRWLTRWLGSAGERTAARYLRQQGMRILLRNHRNFAGEIDLIAVDGETIVFVEVKSRSGRSAGEPWEAVDRRKQDKLTSAAMAFLQRRKWFARRTRFDVVSVILSESDDEPEIRHDRNAFEPTRDF